ncbi:MAG: hypothetical protein IKB28_07385 [Clostridia bacterium]|nr:hypothetical protein [Clostridia bacterium]
MKKTLSILSIALLLLLTLYLVACGDKQEITESCVTEVTLNKKGTEINVEAALTEADLETFRNSGIYTQKLYLMALEPGDTTETLSGRQPVAESGMNTSPKFSLPIYADGNLQAHSRLHCAFAVAVYNKTLDSYVLLTPPVYVSNVSDLAENTADFPKAASIKGLHAAVCSDAAYLGVSHAVVELDPSVLILDGYSQSAVTYVYDGQTYYLDRGALEALDKQVSEYTAQGAIVYLRLRMRTAPEKANSLVSCLYAVSEGSSKARAYGIWMDDDQSASLMAGFLDFITARYTDPAGTHGFCGALIIGRSVNEASTNNYVGTMDFDKYVSRYQALVRLAHSTLKSHYANGRVYVSVSNNLADINSLSSKSDWTTNYFLDQYNIEALYSGGFDWHVAISAYAYGSGSQDPTWSDENASALKLSPAHFSDFGWIADPEHYFDGNRRHTIISDFEVAPGQSQQEQAASYAYAYYKALENGHVDALIYSAHTDEQSLIKGSGLWATDNKGQMTERRALYNVFMTIDTKDASQLDAIGISSMVPGWSSLYSAQSAKAATRQFVTGADVTGAPSSKSQVLFSFVDGTTCHFTPDGSVSYLELTKDATLGWPVLAAHLDRTQPQTYMGISNTVLQGSEIKGIKTLALTVCADADTESPVSVKLRLVKKGTSTISAGDETVVYEEVTEILPNSWQVIYFDVSDFTSLADGDDPITVSVQLKVPELAEDGTCTLLVDRVDMYGSFGVQFYEWIIILVSVIAVLALIAGLVYLLYRKYGAPPIIANIFWNASKGKIRLRRYKKTR